jgi:hypothetical protein
MKFTSPIRTKSLVIVLALICAIGQFVVPTANAAISGWTLTNSQPDFSSDAPTWTVTLATNDSAGALLSGDVATFIIEDTAGQALGSLDQEISSSTTTLTFVVPLDSMTASSDATQTDFNGIFLVSHPVDDDEIIEIPLSKSVQAADWKLSSSNLVTTSKPYIWTLKFNAVTVDSALANGDTAELFISDLAGNQLVDENLTVTKNNTTTISFKISIDPATLNASWSADALDGMLILQSASGNQQLVEFPAPISGLPDRPTTVDQYVKSTSDYSTKAVVFQPASCSDVPVSAQLDDPYHDVINVLFALNDSSGNTVAQAVDESVSGSTFSTSLYICPDDLKGLSSPFKLVTGLTFITRDRDYSELTSPFLWKMYVKPVVKAPVVTTTKPKVVKITCVRLKPYSKITTTKAKCPTGYKKK